MNKIIDYIIKYGEDNVLKVVKEFFDKNDLDIIIEIVCRNFGVNKNRVMKRGEFLMYKKRNTFETEAFYYVIYFCKKYGTKEKCIDELFIKLNLKYTDKKIYYRMKNEISLDNLELKIKRHKEIYDNAINAEKEIIKMFNLKK